MRIVLLLCLAFLVFSCAPNITFDKIDSEPEPAKETPEPTVKDCMIQIEKIETQVEEIRNLVTTQQMVAQNYLDNMENRRQRNDD